MVTQRVGDVDYELARCNVGLAGSLATDANSSAPARNKAAGKRGSGGISTLYVYSQIRTIQARSHGINYNSTK